MTKLYKVVLPVFLLAAVALIFGIASPESWGRRHDDDDGGELPLGAATVVIELTDNDIELQAFIDGSPAWDRF